MAGLFFLIGLLLLCALAAVIGLIEARLKKRNALGWIVSAITSIVGAIGGTFAAGLAMEATGLFKTTGPEFDSFPIFAGFLLGAWGALILVNLFRDRGAS
jgi:uncharacterized membrane protein YeaQ/YmgE (transglycosylase-associated protein family)